MNMNTGYLQPPLLLRELRITDTRNFQRFPTSIGRLKHLKKIILQSGLRLINLPDEICSLQSLEHLELPWCLWLCSLPAAFGDLTNLLYLDMSCSGLRELPVSFKHLINLEYLNLSICKILNLRSDTLENITKLKYLSLNHCHQLQQLPHQVTNQASLKELYLINGFPCQHWSTKQARKVENWESAVDKPTNFSSACLK
ncbi:hypothetical protein SUGI_0687060 [Cryptomeria japonica]|nr:hypothetical protein SUGI_0687060 [Cryptomeria japonica]